jgi:hypothetical protein
MLILFFYLNLKFLATYFLILRYSTWVLHLVSLFFLHKFLNLIFISDYNYLLSSLLHYFLFQSYFIELLSSSLNLYFLSLIDLICFLIISVQLVNQCLTVPHLIFFIYLFQIIVRKMYYVHLMNFVEKYFYFVEIILNFCIIVYVPLKYYSIYLNFWFKFHTY